MNPNFKANRIYLGKLQLKKESKSQSETVVKNAIEKFKDFLPIVTLLLYVYGYIYLTNYYNFFNISIVYYLNLTDLTFVALSQIISLSIIIFITEMIFFLISTGLVYILNEMFGKKLNLEISKQIRYFIILALYCTIKFLRPEYSYLIVSYLIISLLYDAFCSQKLAKSQKKYQSYMLITLILLFSYQLIQSYACYHANEVKFKYDNNDRMSIKTDAHEFKINGITLKKIGETNSNFFIYDSKHKSTLIINKSDIIETTYTDNSPFPVPNLIEDIRITKISNKTTKK
ncbi:hypothetical protein ACLI08_08510 [Flavobacterium sp. RNTU_13]|uniref:hypothetical protein n=1 Tax=Flavobacterium sp. RNTU_13 TaxID=3375145 RepID=UPI003987E586